VTAQVPKATDLDDAVLALIRQETELAQDVFDGELRRPGGQLLLPAEVPNRYVLVHSNRGVIRPDRFTGPARRRRKTYWVHAVGLSKRQAEAVSERVIARLLNVRLVVPGWQCDPITHEASQPIDVDKSVKPARYFGVDQFDLYTSPAPETT
jgi:hypothetical protein